MRSLLHSSRTSLWSERSTASKEQLQSIIGVLSFAAKVVAPGRTFLRRMIDHMKNLPSNTANTTQHPLSKSFHLIYSGGVVFLLNGMVLVSFLIHMDTSSCIVDLYRCMCRRLWCIVWFHWFSCTWTVEEEQQAARDKRDSMPFKELYALTKAATTWGSQWPGRKILFHTDCQPIVDAWRKGDSRKPQISHLIRTLLFIAATHYFQHESCSYFWC